ncbi:hypothetical protein [Stetteria hydrogenophila]
MGTVRARVTVRGSLAVIETEYGQKAVIPADTLCAFLARYKIKAEGLDFACPQLETTGAQGVEVDYDDSEEEG